MRDVATRERDWGKLAEIEARQGYYEVLLGNSEQARRHAAASLHFKKEQPVMVLALLGDVPKTRELVDKMSGDAASDGFISRLWLPDVQAAIELRQGNPRRAVELLMPVTPYESGWVDHYISAYLRGESYLAMRRGPEASAEFEKIIDHPGVVMNEPIGALAHLGLARAHAMQGDTAKARAAYQDFLMLWKNADSDIPVLISAKLEYAKLQ